MVRADFHHASDRLFLTLQTLKQKVMDGLHLLYARRCNPPLGELRQPINSHPCPLRDFSLSKAGTIEQLIRTFKKVHRIWILAITYLTCKQDFTRA